MVSANWSKLLKASVFHNFPIPEQDNPVKGTDGIQPVGDGNDIPAVRQGRGPPSITSSSVRLSIAEVDSSSIMSLASENHSRARARRCRSPPDSLTPRSPSWVSKSILQPLKPFQKLDLFQGADRICIRQGGIEYQVFTERAVKDRAFLGNISNMPVVIVQLYTAQLLIVNQYLAAIRKQPGQKLYQRGFAGAAASRQGNFFAGGYRKGKDPAESVFPNR